MKNCTYDYGEYKNKTYNELVNLLKDKDIYGVLYSLVNDPYNKQQQTYEQLRALKEKGLKENVESKKLEDAYKFLKKKKPYLSDDPEIVSVADNNYTAQTLVDSGVYTDIYGNPIVRIMNDEEYLAYKRQLMESQQLSKEEINTQLSILRNKGSNIAQDSYDLHKILLKEWGTTRTDEEGNAHDLEETKENVKDTAFESFANRIHEDIYDSVIGEVFKKNGKYSKEQNDMSTARVLKNITLSAPLNIGGKVYTHIDFLAIKPDGSIEVFFLKITHENPSAWDNVKLQKYKHEAAITLQVLKANGIDTSNVTFNYIPIILNYDDNFEQVQEIQVDRAKSLSHSKGGFIIHEELSQARRFIDTQETEVEIKDESLVKVTSQLSALFPEMGIRANGIELTVEEYVERNWPYIIQKELPGGKGYEIKLAGKDYIIKDARRGKSNSEIINLVKQHQKEIMDNESSQLSARFIASRIRDGRRYGFCAIEDPYVSKFFEKYYARDEIKELDNTIKYQYKWEVISNPALEAANVIIFKNKETKQIDVVLLSQLNLKIKQQLNHQSNILGFHLSDMQAQDNQGNELLEASNGNIEIMRGLFLVNEIIPDLLKDGEIKLGNIEVVGGLGTTTHGLSYPMSLVTPNFIKARKVLNDKDQQLNIPNNFQQVKNVNPAYLLIEEFSDILINNPGIGSDFKALRELFYGTGYNESGQSSENYDGFIRRNMEAVASLQVAVNQNSVDAQMARLEDIIEAVSTILKKQGGGANMLNPKVLIANAQSTSESDKLISACSKILINASIALDKLAGVIRVSHEEMATIDSYFARPQNMEDSQVRIVSKLLQDAIHQVSSKLDPVISQFSEQCDNYLKMKGFSSVQNLTLGGQSNVFKHLFRDIEEELLFKNPYDDSEDLDEHDRSFLKKVLFLFAKGRYPSKDFTFKDENDPNILAFIKKNSETYFYVPLEKASSATKWSNPSSYFKDFQRRAAQYCKEPLLFFREMYEGIMSDEERELISRDMENLQTRNPFRQSSTERGRQYLLKRFGKHTFETNIRNLVIDYAFKNLQEEEMNKMLIRARGILLYLYLNGIREEGRGSEKYAKEIKHIDDYLTTSVFDRSIMEPDNQKLIARITPLRKALTHAYIAISPVAAVRDVIQGFISGITRTATKFRTDIDVSDVLWGYQYVLGRGVNSIGSIDLLDKMNAKYLISNINIEQQQEGYKTDTHGITNPGNIAYATLKKPDYLNRMVLFTAKLKHDGSLPAYSVENGQLVYNWRMDKRFNLLAEGNTSDMKAYNEQKAKKLSLIVALNNENPGLNLKVDVNTDIPDGYTNEEIESIKSLGDVMYGSYNKSTKAKYEHLALGSQFGAFSTWMNGIYDVYFGKRHASSYQFTTQQAEDENGNLLYFDENNNITTTPTDIPYLKDVPMMVQGVLRTIVKDIGGDIIFNGGKGLKDIWNDPAQQMNCRRAISDLIVAVLLTWLFKYFITPAYQKHKAEDDGTDIVGNAILEVMYKGSSTSFDELKGPLPVIEYISDNTNPAAYKWLSRTSNDLFKLVTGDKTLGETIVRAQALPRALQDTYKMYKRDTRNGVEE